MTGPEVLIALQRHAKGRHSKGGMMLNGEDIKSFVAYLEASYFASQLLLTARGQTVWEGEVHVKREDIDSFGGSHTRLSFKSDGWRFTGGKYVVTISKPSALQSPGASGQGDGGEFEFDETATDEPLHLKQPWVMIPGPQGLALNGKRVHVCVSPIDEVVS